MKVPSAGEIARRFTRYAPQRSDRYEEGVRNPAEDWATKTAEAEANYAAGVQKAVARKGFSQGVKKCGTQKQQAKTITKGIPRWSEGISGAEDDMRASMENVVKVMESIKLPPRYPKGDPRNYERSKTVGMELRKAKEEGKI